MPNTKVSPGMEAIIEAAFLGSANLPIDRQAFLYRHMAEICAQKPRKLRFLELAEAAEQAYAQTSGRQLDAAMTLRIDSLSRQ